MTRLAELISIKHGFAFAGEHFSDSPTEFVLLTPGNFRIGGGFKADKFKYYGGPVPDGYVLSPGDLVVTMTDLSKNMDTLGYPALVPSLEGRTALHNQRIGLVTVTSPDVDAGWLYWVMCGEAYRHEILASSTGTTVHHTSPSRILAFDVNVPPLSEQRGIAATLGSLRAKLESNERTSRTCLELAHALFLRSAKAATPMPLGSVATLALGGTPDRKRLDYWIDGTVPWINSGAANQDVILSPTELITEKGLAESAAKLMPSGATVVAITGATLGQVALLGIQTAGNQSLVGVWSDDPDMSAWLHFAVRESIPRLLGTATGAAQQHVNKGNLEELFVLVPQLDDLREWASTARPLIERALSMQRESRNIERLREALLPELLSGRMKVSDTAPDPVGAAA